MKGHAHAVAKYKIVLFAKELFCSFFVLKRRVKEREKDQSRCTRVCACVHACVCGLRVCDFKNMGIFNFFAAADSVSRNNVDLFCNCFFLIISIVRKNWLSQRYKQLYWEPVVAKLRHLFFYFFYKFQPLNCKTNVMQSYILAGQLAIGRSLWTNILPHSASPWPCYRYQVVFNILLWPCRGYQEVYLQSASFDILLTVCWYI